MKKFNALVNAKTTYIMLRGAYEFLKVTSVNATRVNVTLEGLEGSFQMQHVLRFTNKFSERMNIAQTEFYADQCASVYQARKGTYYFVGKLNGRTLKQFLLDNDLTPLR